MGMGLCPRGRAQDRDISCMGGMERSSRVALARPGRRAGTAPSRAARGWVMHFVVEVSRADSASSSPTSVGHRAPVDVDTPGPARGAHAARPARGR